jgi:DNA-binding CsgD family transcriptional regulator
LVDQSDYNQLLDLVYESAVEPDLWPQVLGRLAALTGANAGVLIQQDEATGKGQGIRSNVDPAATELYYGYFATRNVLHNTPDPIATLRRWKPCVLTDEDKLPKSSLMSTEYYNDFMRRFDVHSLLMIRIAVLGMDSITLNLMRPANRERFGGEEIALARRLHPHLIRAFDLGQKFAATRALKEDMAESIDRSAHGVFLVDRFGRVDHVNRAGRILTAEPGGLCLVAGRLSAARPDQARRLEALIAVAAAADPDLRRGGSMALTVPARRLPLSLIVIPVRVERRSIFDPGPSAIVCVSDLEAGVKLPQQTLRDLFNLTAAEARVASSLFEGATPRETADSLCISFQTVRVHLTRIFEKTGTRGQTELARLMMRAIGAQLEQDPPALSPR